MPPTVRSPSCQPEETARLVTTAMSGPGTTVSTARTPVAANNCMSISLVSHPRRTEWTTGAVRPLWSVSKCS